jgi:hypothetical protein
MKIFGCKNDFIATTFVVATTTSEVATTNAMLHCMAITHIAT